MIDFVILIGVIIIGLGYENVGVFFNDDKFCNVFFKVVVVEGEGVWCMFLGKVYVDQLKFCIVDVKNVGGCLVGLIIVVEFLYCFVQDGIFWIYLDIVGVVLVKVDLVYVFKGVIGWGVMVFNCLVEDMFEVK